MVQTIQNLGRIGRTKGKNPKRDRNTETIPIRKNQITKDGTGGDKSGKGRYSVITGENSASDH